MEGVFGDRRKAAVCRSPASRPTDSGTLQRVRNLPQDRLQTLPDFTGTPGGVLALDVQNVVFNLKEEADE
jgi:hypothetical protein